MVRSRAFALARGAPAPVIRSDEVKYALAREISQAYVEEHWHLKPVHKKYACDKASVRERRHLVEKHWQVLNSQISTGYRRNGTSSKSSMPVIWRLFRREILPFLRFLRFLPFFLVFFSHRVEHGGPELFAGAEQQRRRQRRGGRLEVQQAAHAMPGGWAMWLGGCGGGGGQSRLR